MKNVIIVNDTAYNNGGAGKIAINTAIELSETQQYNVIYFSASGPIDDKLIENKIKVISLGLPSITDGKNKISAIARSLWNTKAKKAFEILINSLEKRNTIVHVHCWTKSLSSSFFKVIKENNIKTYVTLHDYFLVCPNGGFYNYKKRRACILTPMSSKCIRCNCDKKSYLVKIYRVIRQYIQNRYIKNNRDIKYIYVSEFSIEKMKKYILSSKYYYLHNPIDSFYTSDIDFENNDIFLFIGRLSDEKGLDLFCEAITDLDLRGVVIGDGPLAQTFIDDYPNIEFVGWKSKKEIIEYYKKSKCLLFTSRCYETDGLVVQEALSAGLPCIVSDKCASKVYIRNKKNGYLFSGCSLDDLKEVIRNANYDELDPYLVGDSETYMDNLIKIYEEE